MFKIVVVEVRAQKLCRVSAGVFLSYYLVAQCSQKEKLGTGK